MFVGDGESDRYAAGYADIVFAKRALVRICLEAGWPFDRCTEFREIQAWLDATLERWSADPTSLERVPAGAPPEVTSAAPRSGARASWIRHRGLAARALRAAPPPGGSGRQDVGPVRDEGLVATHDDRAEALGLRHEHAIERIAMMGRERTGALRVAA